MRTAMLSLCAFSALAVPALAATVNNPSFEVNVPVMGGPLTTDWRYDVHSFVTAENGITPAAGNRMLKFLATSPSGPGSGSACDVFQIIDLTSPADQALIAGGSASAICSALFNRVDNTAGVLVDNQFNFALRSHTSLANAQSLTATNTVINTLFSDGNLATWESLGGTLALPVGTQYVSIQLVGVENVINDVAGPEFAGHYADDVRFTLAVPAPGSAVLAGLGALAVARRRR